MNFEQEPTLEFDSVVSSVETDSYISTKRSSMIFSVLPAIVQSRIPAIPSIRRTISDFRGNSDFGGNAAKDAETGQLESPPPGYTSRPGSARSSSTCNSIDSNDVELPFQECFSTRPQSSMGTPPAFHLSDRRTGINWRYANQGISLATQACAESHTLARRDDETSTILTRQLYIHGMTYFLRGLPSDLTAEETLSLQAATPSSVAIIHNEPCSHAIVPFTQEPKSPQESPNASTLHRITAIIVFQAFVMIELLLPYVKLFIGYAYCFEREHKVTQKLVSNGVMTADVLRRRSLQLSHTICQMGDGRVGQALNDMMIWWVRGLTGGLQQGITEGITRMGSERPKTPKRLE